MLNTSNRTFADWLENTIATITVSIFSGCLRIAENARDAFPLDTLNLKLLVWVPVAGHSPSPRSYSAAPVVDCWFSV